MFSLDTSLGFRVSRLAASLRGELERRLARHDLTAPQWASLIRLQTGGPLSQRCLGDDLGFDKATIGGIVGRLEAKGLVERHKGEDRRVSLVSLTAAGDALARQTSAYGEEINRRALSGFSDEERSRLLADLSRMTKALAEG